MQELTVDIWSDIACPWCYIGKRRLESALARFPDRDKVVIRWHAFELDPSAPRVRPTSGSHAADLAKKYGVSRHEAEGMIANVVRQAAGVGLDFEMDALRPGNTFDAHRVVGLAAARGGGALQNAMTERFMRAYLMEGEALGERDTLVRLAGEVGLDRDEVRAVLASDAFAEAVRADEAQASAVGISGVPTFVLDWKYGVTGAQPPEVLLGALTRAWSERTRDAAEGHDATVADGAACGPDGC